MNYDKYKQEERDFIRYWNQHDVVAEEETIQKQTKQLKRISYWAKKVQDKFNEEERDVDRLEHRYCRCNNIEEDMFFIDDRWDDEYFLSWKEYEHLTEELDVAGMTCSELAACLPFFGLYPFWNPSDTRYRRNKNRYQLGSIPNVSNKDCKFLIQLYNKVYDEGHLPNLSSWHKSRTSRLADALYDTIWKKIRKEEERDNILDGMKERLSSDGDEVLVDTEYNDQINGKMEEELKESLSIPAGTIIEIYQTSLRSNTPKSWLNWGRNDYTKGSESICFPFREDTVRNGKMERMKSISKIMLRSLQHLLPTHLYEFAPEGVILELWTKIDIDGVKCKIFIPYDRLRETINDLYKIKRTLVSWFSFIPSLSTFYNQHYLLVSKEAKKYIDVA